MELSSIIQKSINNRSIILQQSIKNC